MEGRAASTHSALWLSEADRRRAHMIPVSMLQTGRPIWAANKLPPDYARPGL